MPIKRKLYSVSLIIVFLFMSSCNGNNIYKSTTASNKVITTGICVSTTDVIPITSYDLIEMQDTNESTIHKVAANIHKVAANVEEIDPCQMDSSISYIEVDSNNKHFVSVNGIVYTKDFKTLVWCPQNYYANEVIIPYSTEIIGQCAFYKCCNIIKVEMPDSVLEIERQAFSQCGMKEIKFSRNLKCVGNEAFWGCQNLLEVNLPDTASYSNGGYQTMWAHNVFQGCSSLEMVRIPCNNIISYADGPSEYPMFENSFGGCLNLKEFILSDNANELTIYYDALATKSLSTICRHLPKSEINSFIIPSDTEVLGEYAFEGCLNLNELIIKQYEGFGERRFRINGNGNIKGCVNLERMVILDDTDIVHVDLCDFPSLIIYAVEGSKADEYAKNNGIPIIYVDNYDDYLKII